MAAFEFSPNNEAGVPLYTFGDAVRDRNKTLKDFAAACGISVVRARRLLKGGFIPKSLDVHAIAKLLDYDTRTVIALRKQHNERYHLQSDRGTVWSVPSDDVAGAEMTSGRTTFDPSEQRPISHVTLRHRTTSHLIFPSNPATCKKRSSGGFISDVRIQ